MQARHTVATGRWFRSATALQPGSLPSRWSTPLVAPLRATSCGTSPTQASRCGAAARFTAAQHRRSASVSPRRRGACVPPVCSASAAQPLSAAKAVGGPAFGRQQSRGRTGGHLHSRATRSGGTAESTARSGPGESGEMNGKHSFLSGYDDAWDSGSNGVGGHPPVAVITTLGCPHCKRVKEALSGTGIEYEEIELSGQLKLLESIKKTTGRTTVPQVFLGGLLIGGADETLAALGDGSFQAALEGGGVGGALPAHLRDEVDLALQHTPRASTTAIPQPLLPEDMPEERYQTLRAVADSIHTGLVPGGNYMFTLAEGVEWLRRAKLVQSMDAALATLADLQRAHLLFVADGSGADLSAVDAGLSVDPRTGAPSAPAATAATVLQLVQDAPLPRLGDTLNARVPWYGDAQPASQVAEGLRTLMLGLYDVHLAPDGRSVDYPALVRDPNFADYTTAATELQKVNLLQMSRDERMAFFINIYNALVVHAMALFGPAKSTIKRLYWFGAVKYNIGGMDFSANDVEHGVLRANAASPTSVGSLLGRPDWAGRQFKPNDPRLPLVVEPLDPRIHFALVCGAKSCPPIRVYTPASLEAGLEAAAQAFCSGEVEIDHEARELTMSMIFKWYKADFGPPDVMLPWLLQFLPHDVAHELEDMLAHDGGAATIKISHRPYDWGVNTAEY